jgi:uncharacterized repeat protein (TIGR04042 family)
MPELTFTTRWPDGRSLQTYSPSLVVHDHLEAGRSYTVAEFVDRAAAALTEASDRVEARWGRPCTAARASLATIRHYADGQHGQGLVAVESIDPPALPAESVSS